jgi:hypothetical protein
MGLLAQHGSFIVPVFDTVVAAFTDAESALASD